MDYQKKTINKEHKKKHIEFLKNEIQRIFNDIELTSISFDTFEKKFKKRYEL